MWSASISRTTPNIHSRRSAVYTGSSGTSLMYRPHFPTYARNTSRKRIAREVPTGQVQLKRGSIDTEHGVYQPLQCMLWRAGWACLNKGWWILSYNSCIQSLINTQYKQFMFRQRGGYLNFCACLMKKSILFE